MGCCRNRSVLGKSPFPEGKCVTLSFQWETPVQDILIDLSIPFDPAVSFSPPPEVIDPMCCQQGDPRFSRCVFASPGINHFGTEDQIDPFAIEKLGGCKFLLVFACLFVGEICFNFCCQSCGCD